METKFRRLREDEIDCRVSTISEKGCLLLLYKDARVDQNILDETVGCLSWKRSHQSIDGNLYCTVEIWDDLKQEWIAKQDVGTESYTEKEKGQASDSFKRACFNLGIGRELYTAPFIWIAAGDVTLKKPKDKYITYDKFVVENITYTENCCISSLSIKNENLGRVVYTYNLADNKKNNSRPVANKASNKPVTDKTETKSTDSSIEQNMMKKIKAELVRTGVTESTILNIYGVKSFSGMSHEMLDSVLKKFKATPDKGAA